MSATSPFDQGARPCPYCGHPMKFHTKFACCTPFAEPTLCTCETPDPDGIGECRCCRRRVLTPEMVA